MNRSIQAAIAALVVLALVWSSLFTVDQTETALVLRLGALQEAVTDPGLHFKIPLIDRVVSFDARLLDLAPEGSTEIILKDQMRIDVDTYTLFRIGDPLLFFQTVRSESVARVQLDQIVENAVRQVLGNYLLTDVLSPKREAIMSQILDQARSQAKARGIAVIDVRIRRADLPNDTSQAIYARMQSERQRDAAEARGQGQMQSLQIRADADRQATVIRADAQKQAEILRGQGDAEATGIYAQAYGQDPKFYNFYRSLQAYRQALAGSNTSYVLTLQSDFFRFLASPPTGLSPPGAGSATAPAPSPTQGNASPP